MSEAVHDLAALLANAKPTLSPDPVAVATCDGDEIPEPLRAHTIAFVRETEGLTLYLDLVAAEAAGLRIVFRAAWITMNVHSDLQAVGFTAAFARVLAQRGIAANVVAGAFHDHIFVPFDKRLEAMAALCAL